MTRPMPASGHGRPRCRNVDCPWGRLLDDDHVGGLLGRIRAVGYLIGAVSEVDPAQLRAAGWLIESLADEAEARLKSAVQRTAHDGCQASQHGV